MIIGVGIDVAERGEEGVRSNLGLLESLLVQPSFRLVLVGGVLTLVFSLGVGVLALVLGLGGLMIVFVGAVGDEVVETATSKAPFLLSTAPTVHAVVVKPREFRLMTNASSSSPSTSSCSFETEAKEDKANKSCEVLVKELELPVPVTNAMV